MARVLVIEPHPGTGASLAEMLRRLGHVPELMPQLDRPPTAPPALVLAAAGPSGERVRDTLMAAAAAAAGAPLIWTGRSQEAVSSFLAAGMGQGFLAVPPRLPALMSALRRSGVDAGDEGWSGHGFLVRASGPAHRVQPARMAFLGHRVAASGRLRVGAAEVVLRGGRIAGCTGVPGLLGGGSGELMAALGAAIGAGTPADQALERAGLDIAAWWLGGVDPDAEVRFIDEGAGAPRSPVVLPTPIPRLLAVALAAGRSAAAVRAGLDALGDPTLRVAAPDDSPETQWGLSPVDLRVLRAGTRVGSLHALVQEAGGAEREEVWRSLDYLLTLGLLRIGDTASDGLSASDDGGSVVEAIEGQAAAPAVDLDALVGRARAPDPAVVELERALAALDGAPPWALFEITTPEQLAAAELDKRFRERSAAHHPDRHVGAPEAVRALHEAIFAAWSDARSALDAEPLRAEVRERLRASAEGRPFVSEADRRRARLLATKAEHAARGKRWAEALAHADEGLAADPESHLLRLHRAHAAWRSGALPPAEAAAQLAPLKGETRAENAEIHFLRGEMLVEAGDAAAAAAAFAKVLEVDPEHVGAKRRQRLTGMRAEQQAPPKRTGLAALFPWGRKGG